MDKEESAGPIPISDAERELFWRLFEKRAEMGVVRVNEDYEIEYHPESYPG